MGLHSWVRALKQTITKSTFPIPRTTTSTFGYLLHMPPKRIILDPLFGGLRDESGEAIVAAIKNKNISTINKMKNGSKTSMKKFKKLNATLIKHVVHQ